MAVYDCRDPSRARITQAESKRLTRQSLLDAALRQMMEKGFSAASIEDIAREAGFSRGAFYSNFSSKKDLLTELLARLRDEDLAALHTLTISHNAPPAEMSLHQLIMTVFLILQRNGAGVIARAEARMLASRDPEFRAWFSAFSKQTRTHLARHIHTLCARTGRVTVKSPDQIAVSLILLAESAQLARLSGEDDSHVVDEHVLACSMEEWVGAGCEDDGTGSSSRRRAAVRN
jgi:AcrR family transcriptional regulator